MNFSEICKHFDIEARTAKIISKGLINKSWQITDTSGKKYVVQGINTHTFKDVEGLMSNISNVTEHIKKKIIENGGDEEREVLSIIKANDGKTYWGDDKNGYYRIYNCITEASTYDEANYSILFEAGRGFGRFQKLLSDFPADKLIESIPDFHNTPKRYDAFLKQLSDTEDHNCFKAIKEIYSIIDNEAYGHIITDALASKKIPMRVVHNDTKLNNVMIDDNTHKAVCVVDLDTIMPGSLLYDYGDAIRFCANSGCEDDRDLDKVKIDTRKFMAFTHGFLSETVDSITQEELDLMCKAPAVLSYELAMRFLTDYLDGNKYFKCDPDRPLHNLERAQSQLKLFGEFKAHEKDMDRAIKRIYSMCKSQNKNKTI